MVEDCIGEAWQTLPADQNGPLDQVEVSNGGVLLQQLRVAALDSGTAAVRYRIQAFRATIPRNRDGETRVTTGP
jgi:hypothetical protein